MIRELWEEHLGGCDATEGERVSFYAGFAQGLAEALAMCRRPIHEAEEVRQSLQAELEGTMNTSQCRACKAKIVWVRSLATGRMMPLDTEPAEDGNVYLNDQGQAIVLAGKIDGPIPPGGRPRYKSHFATCPQAKEFRKPKSPAHQGD